MTQYVLYAILFLKLHIFFCYLSPPVPHGTFWWALNPIVQWKCKGCFSFVTMHHDCFGLISGVVMACHNSLSLWCHQAFSGHYDTNCGGAWVIMGSTSWLLELWSCPWQPVPGSYQEAGWAFPWTAHPLTPSPLVKTSLWLWYMWITLTSIEVVWVGNCWLASRLSGISGGLSLVATVAGNGDLWWTVVQSQSQGSVLQTHVKAYISLFL